MKNKCLFSQSCWKCKLNSECKVLESQCLVESKNSKIVSDPLCQRRIIKKSNKGERWDGGKANKSQHQAKDGSKSFLWSCPNSAMEIE